MLLLYNEKMKRKILNNLIYIVIPIFSVIICRILKIAQGEINEEVIAGIMIGIAIDIIYLVMKEILSYIGNRKINKKTIIIGITFLSFILMFSYYKYFKLSDFDKAKKDAINFLNNNITELQSISNEILESKNSKKYKNKIYTNYKNSGEKEYIQFDIDSQGMLGGQYWGIIYSPNDDLLGEETRFIYNEQEETGKGNNIFIKEKIKDNWYFYYDDYDR